MARMQAQAAVDAVALLKADHRTVEGLFAKFESARGAASKLKIAQQICLELCVHAQIEEEIFYPAARKAGVDGDLLDEADIEHGSAKQLIAEIGAAQATDSHYDARVKVLGEYIRHHVKDEEGELFPACRKSDMDMAGIGGRLQERKNQLLRKLNGK